MKSLPTFNPRKLTRESLEGLIACLNNTNSSLLIVPEEVAAVINSLTPFSGLKESTPIQNVAYIDSKEFPNAESCTIIFDADLNTTNAVIKLVAKLQMKVNIAIIGNEIPLFVTKQFEDGNVLGDVLSWLTWDCKPMVLDVDLISLNYPASLQKMYIHDTTIVPFKVAEALNGILVENPQLFLTNILAKGKRSSEFVKILKDKQEEHIKSLSPQEQDSRNKVIQGLYGEHYSGKQCDLIVLERECDMVTPLLTQLTYAGLIDDIYEIQGNKVSFEAEGQDIDLVLNDEVWSSLQDLNFAAVGPFLNQTAKQLQAEFDKRHEAQEISEIKQFVDKLGDLQYQQATLKNHTLLSEEILAQVNINEQEIDDDSLFNRIMELQQELVVDNFDNKTSCDKIVELIWEQVDYRLILRLIGLVSLVKNGIRDKEYKTLHKEFIETYGFEHEITFFNMSKLGLYNERGSSVIRDFNTLRSSLNLVPDTEQDTDPLNPLDASFAYPGYVPLSVRLIQAAFDRSHLRTKYSQPFVHSAVPSWLKLDDLANLPGPTVNDRLIPQATKQIGKLETGAPVFIVYLGGITYGEVSCLRYINQQLKSKGIDRRFVVLTDSILSGDRLCETLVS